MPKPNRPVLQVPQAEARKAIEEQVDQGRKVLASIDLGFPSDLDSKFSRAEKDREKWANLRFSSWKTYLAMTLWLESLEDGG